MRKYTKKEIFSIPNLMGYFRILMIPVFCYLYLTDHFYPAIVVIIISSITDMLDGMVARKFHMVTELGKMLDPVADKLTHAALAICLAFHYPLMWVLVVLMAVKEGYMAVMGIRNLRSGKEVYGAKWFGKACTAFLFVSMIMLFAFPGISVKAANWLIGVTMLVMAGTLVLYWLEFQKK